MKHTFFKFLHVLFYSITYFPKCPTQPGTNAYFIVRNENLTYYGQNKEYFY
jgi:hypothetical protein